VCVVFPILLTSRLILRELHDEDLDSFIDIFSRDEVTRYYGRDVVTSSEEANDLLQKMKSGFLEKRGIRWGIEARDTKQLIGTIGYHLWSPLHKRAEVGYELHPDYWNKGYATEAIKTALSYGFQEMDLNRISAIVYFENQASNRLLEKIGFQKEGIKREYMLQGNQFHDTYFYSLLKSDYHEEVKND
jgi:[ribosomal protein S5]-alanine N-acetyltransferase